MYVLIANQEPLGRHLAARLVSHGHEVAYVDDELEYCNQVASETGCLVIHGEVTNLRVLQSAGLERADALVAILDKDVKNIQIGLFARQFGVERIVARLRQEHYRAAYELAGIATVVSSFDYLLNELLVAVENPTIRRFMALGDGQIEMAAIEVAEESPLVGEGIDAIFQHRGFPVGALVLGLLHADDQRMLLPRDAPVLRGADEVLVVGTPEDVQRIAEIVGAARRSLRRPG